MAGRNGTVVSYATSSGGGMTVVVSFPAEPGPPPQTAHQNTYEVTDSERKADFRAAKAGKSTVDCTGDSGTDGGTVTVK